MMNWLKCKATPLMVLILLLSGSAWSQQLLTKREAAKIVLENNYNIQIAENDVAIAENNTDPRNNGYLPNVNANAGTNASLRGSSLKFDGRDDVKVNNAFSWGANASVGADYTIIDRSRDASLEQLKEVLKLTDLQLRQTVENNLLQMFIAYYEVARLTENLSVQAETMEVSRQRLLRAQYRYDYGQGIRLDVLNAQVDIQRDSINYLNIQQQLANSKRDFNVILGRDVQIPFEVDTTVTYARNMYLVQLLEKTQLNNIEILLTDKNLDITRIDYEIIDAGRKPTIGANASYDFSFSDNQPTSPFAPTFNNNRGLGVGLNLNWNIFDGGRRKVQEQNTKITIESQQIDKVRLQQQLERDVTNAWDSYQTALFILEAERDNLSTARLNLDRTTEQFRIGQITSVEFRQAQLNLLNAATSYNTAKYDAKVIEIQLFQLSGGLLDVSF